MNETTSKQVSMALDSPEAWAGIAGAACEEPCVAARLADAAMAILDLLPRCPDRTRALNALREAGLYAGQCLHSVP